MKKVKANHKARALVTEEDAKATKREIVQRHLLAGRTVKEVVDMRICSDAVVYNERRVLESEGKLAVDPTRKRRGEGKDLGPPLMETIIHDGSNIHFFSEPATFERVWRKMRDKLIP